MRVIMSRDARDERHELAAISPRYLRVVEARHSEGGVAVVLAGEELDVTLRRLQVVEPLIVHRGEQHLVLGVVCVSCGQLVIVLLVGLDLVQSRLGHGFHE